MLPAGLGGKNLTTTLKGGSLTHQQPSAPDKRQEIQLLQMHGMEVETKWQQALLAQNSTVSSLVLYFTQAN